MVFISGINHLYSLHNEKTKTLIEKNKNIYLSNKKNNKIYCNPQIKNKDNMMNLLKIYKNIFKFI